MYKVLLFAGTIEGRMLAEFLRRHGIAVWVCVATEYGESLIREDEFIHISGERLDVSQMEALMRSFPGILVVDATHPYAAEVTKNIKGAAEAAGCEYLRLLRAGSGQEGGQDHVYVESAEAAARWLDEHEGAALLTTGSKELDAFTTVRDYKDRLYARVLSLPKVVEQCAALGFAGNHLICMQGPFSRELNVAMLRQIGARFLVTKDTGRAGGFPEKEQAAMETGATLVIIGRPLDEQGMSLQECCHELCRRFGIRGGQQAALVGIGMGGPEGMTCEASAWCRESQLLIGAPRMTEGIARPGQAVCHSYRAEEIRDYLEAHPEYEKAAVLLSGDVGFYSGAKKLLELLPGETKVFPGIASVAAFCARLKTSWEDVKLVSAHGKNCNLVGEILHHKKVFTLLGGAGQVQSLCRKLVDYGMDQVHISVGERLSYPEERILTGRPEDFLNLTTDSLVVLLAENASAVREVTHGMPDESFVRDKVPMTKEEVREVSVCKLHLHRDSVVYDVGAGSGSLSVEIAGLVREGRVYAVEKNPEARIVLNAITLETVAEALEMLKSLPVVNTEIVQMSVARSREVGRYHMMMGQNPVYIISCEGGEKR